MLTLSVAKKFHLYSLEILHIIDDKHCSTWRYHENMAYYKIHDQSFFSHTRLYKHEHILPKCSMWWMMENFQIKLREKMVKGYITVETKSNSLYALFLVCIWNKKIQIHRNIKTLYQINFVVECAAIKILQEIG